MKPPRESKTLPIQIPTGFMPKKIVPRLNKKPCAEIASIGVSFFPAGDNDFKRELVNEICAAENLVDLSSFVASDVFPKMSAWLRDKKCPENGILKLWRMLPRPISVTDKTAAADAIYSMDFILFFSVLLIDSYIGDYFLLNICLNKLYSQ